MKKAAIFILMSIIIISGCNSGSGKKLSEGSAAYELAVNISKILPELSPEKNKVLVESNFFTLTTADVILSITQSPGTDVTQFYDLDESELRSAMETITQNLAKRKLLLKASIESGVQCTDAELDDLYKSFETRFGGEAGFDAELEKIEIEKEQFKLELKEGIQRQKYIDNIILKSGIVTEDELIKAYNNMKATQIASVRHILLKTESMTVAQKESVLQKMKGIHRRAVRGENFSALAKRFSEDPGSKDTGGLYEDIRPGEMVEPFNDHAFSVPVGQISEIFETQYGYHILKVIDRQGEVRPFEEIRSDLEKQVKQYKESQALGIEIAHLKIKADMVMKPF